MQMVKMSSCAVQEIDGLSYVCRDNGATAMKEFCRQNFSVSGAKFGGTSANDGELYSFYIFSAACTTPGTSPGSYYTNNYGKRFADYIREHKLGEVIESPILVNKAFHTDHSNQIWIWMPDTAAVRAWWKAHTPVAAAPLPKPAPVARPAPVAPAKALYYAPPRSGVWKDLTAGDGERGWKCTHVSADDPRFACGKPILPGMACRIHFNDPGHASSGYIYCSDCVARDAAKGGRIATQLAAAEVSSND